jgi:hypothetical protein
MPFLLPPEVPPRPESMKFPVFSVLAGNLAFSETSSQLTLPSSGESCANHGLRGDVRHGACSAARDDPQVETLSRRATLSPGLVGRVPIGSDLGLYEKLL